MVRVLGPGLNTLLADCFYLDIICGAKVWDAREEEISARRDWDKTGRGMYVTHMLVMPHSPLVG